MLIAKQDPDAAESISMDSQLTTLVQSSAGISNFKLLGCQNHLKLGHSICSFPPVLSRIHPRASLRRTIVNDTSLR